MFSCWLHVTYLITIMLIFNECDTSVLTMKRFLCFYPFLLVLFLRGGHVATMLCNSATADTQ